MPDLSTTGFVVSCCSIAVREKPVTEALEIIAQAGFTAVKYCWPHVPPDRVGSAARFLTTVFGGPVSR